MKFFRKSSVPQLPLEEASKILAQALAANEMEDNSIPLEVLASYSSYRKERFSLKRVILLIIMILFLMLPFLFVPCSFTVVEDPNLDRDYNPVYSLEVDSFMLVSRVNATIDGYNIPVYEVGAHVYSIEPSRNGQMTVTVTLRNRQTMTQYVDVNTVDREVPTAISCTKEGDQIHLYLSDSGAGIDFEEIEALDLQGQIIEPVSMDEEAGCIVFPATFDTINVNVPDRAGNKLHLILTMG
ncbi:MAG: hypothetical protein HDR71_19955 [Lachnospiraceae bacterium]|nr:hypothetical protein [Lachnospiraceae bacterium]